MPRSGTAFIATLLNLCPTAIAFHELACDDDDWKSTLEAARVGNDYVADCGTYQFLPKASSPESAKVYIDRPIEESRNACEFAVGYRIDLRAYRSMQAIAEDWVAEHHPLVVNFASLWNLSSMETIWNHCFDGRERFPADKVRLLMLNNIQRHEPEKAFSLERCSERAKKLF